MTLIAVRRRSGGAESGQVTTAIGVVTIVALVALAFFGVTKLGLAANDRSEAQSAADAAALAGARAVREEYLAVPGLLGPLANKHALGGLFDAITCSLGSAEARSYAERNDAHLSSDGYCYTVSDDRVRVGVEMDEPVPGESQRARARAQASVGFRPHACTWDDDPAPEPDEPTPTPTTTTPGDGEGDGEGPTTPPPPPPPLPDVFTTLDCGYFTVKFKFDLDECWPDRTQPVDLGECAMHPVGPAEVDDNVFSLRLEH